MATNHATDDVTLGEIHCGLLQHSRPVSTALSGELLALSFGERVRISERPVEYAASPDQLTGVDCVLPAGASGPRLRAIGTATSRATLTGGHVLLGSAFTRVARRPTGRRMPWSYYLAQPGVIEVVGGRAANGVDSLADSFLAGRSGSDVLDLGAIGGRAMDAVQRHERLDHRAPFRSTRTSLRWAMRSRASAADVVTFTLDRGSVRTAHVPRQLAGTSAVAELFEDIALHDWLLTTLMSLVSRAQIGSADRGAVVERLRPAIDYLLHLWMPAARIDRQLTALWEGIERRPGMSRQWRANVDRVRDQLSLATIATVGHAHQ